ncbi:MAG: flagellar brake protein [Gammaproteobacteria bacterium]|nr:flagellar brake protein [Gammaproteobacteria bacterium]
MQLNEMGLQIGTMLQIHLFDDETQWYTVQLIGYHHDYGLIISAPKSSGSELAMILRDDQPLNIRIKSNKAAATFRCNIVEKRMKPYPHIHLSAPSEIESVTVEQVEMIALEQEITFINDDEDSHSTQTELSGISLYEARIQHAERLADEGQRASVTMSFSFADKNNVIVLEGIISSVSEISDSGEQTLTLSYKKLDQSDKILLHAYIYERMLVNFKIIDDPADHVSRSSI